MLITSGGWAKAAYRRAFISKIAEEVADRIHSVIWWKVVLVRCCLYHQKKQCKHLSNAIERPNQMLLVNMVMTVTSGCKQHWDLHNVLLLYSQDNPSCSWGLCVFDLYSLNFKTPSGRG